MNYRHAYHAGNFGDVLKHAVLASILTYLKRKPQPIKTDSVEKQKLAIMPHKDISIIQRSHKLKWNTIEHGGLWEIREWVIVAI